MSRCDTYPSEIVVSSPANQIYAHTNVPHYYSPHMQQFQQMETLNELNQLNSPTSHPGSHWNTNSTLAEAAEGFDASQYDQYNQMLMDNAFTQSSMHQQSDSVTAYAPNDFFRSMMESDISPHETTLMQTGDHSAVGFEAVQGHYMDEHQQAYEAALSSPIEQMENVQLPNGLMHSENSQLQWMNDTQPADLSGTFMPTTMSMSTELSNGSHWIPATSSMAEQYEDSPALLPVSEHLSPPILVPAQGTYQSAAHQTSTTRPGRERLALEIPRHTHSPARDTVLVRRSVSLTNLHQLQQLAQQQGQLLSPGLSPAADGQSFFKSPDMPPAPATLPNYPVSGQKSLAAVSYLPTADYSPSLAPFDGQQQLHPVPSERSAFKSPRILPSRRQRSRSGESGWSVVKQNVGKYPLRTGWGVVAAAVESREYMNGMSKYTTPPYQPYDPPARTDDGSLPTVEMPPPTMCDTPLYVAASSAQASAQSYHSELSSPTMANPQDQHFPPTRTSRKPRKQQPATSSSQYRPPLPTDPKPPAAPAPKTPHKISEKRRRELLKSCFDELMSLLPPPSEFPITIPPAAYSDDANNSSDSDTSPQQPLRPQRKKKTGKKPPNRIEILHRAMYYIQGMEEKGREMDAEVEKLRRELEQFRVGNGGIKCL